VASVGPFIEGWLAAATERMLDAARVGAGCRVLDVAAGAGARRAPWRGGASGPRPADHPALPCLIERRIAMLRTIGLTEAARTPT
jgi:hypothetical protein